LGALVMHPMTMDQLEEKYKRRNRLPFINNKLRLHCRQNKDRLLQSGVIYELSKEQLEYFVHFNNQTRLRHMIIELHHRDENLNAMIETYREGKTPGSVLCGLLYAHECALLVIIHVYDAKKILVDALGTLRTTGTCSL
jgi:hypothetical protein